MSQTGNVAGNVPTELRLTFVPLTPLNAESFIALADRLAVTLAIREPWESVFYYAPPQARRDGFGIRADWRDRLRAELTDLEEVVLARYDGGQRQAIEWLVRDQVVHVVVLADPHEPQEAVADRIAKGHDLVHAPHDLFKYRRSAAVYEPGKWSLKSFADGLEKLVAEFNDGMPVTVHDAYVTYDHKAASNIEELTGSHSLPDFLGALRALNARAVTVHTVDVYFTGAARVRHGEPRGLAMGITIEVTPEPIRLTVRSSLAPAALEQMMAVLSEELSLGEPVKATVSGAQISSGTTKFEEKYLVKTVLTPTLQAVIGAALLLFTVTGYEIAFPDYTVSIASPVAKDGAYTMPPGELALSWYLTPSKLQLRPRLHDARAEVQLFRDGQRLRSVVSEGQATLPLDAGNYQIVISALDKEAGPAQLSLSVAAPAPAAQAEEEPPAQTEAAPPAGETPPAVE